MPTVYYVSPWGQLEQALLHTANHPFFCIIDICPMKNFNILSILIIPIPKQTLCDKTKYSGQTMCDYIVHNHSASGAPSNINLSVQWRDSLTVWNYFFRS